MLTNEQQNLIDNLKAPVKSFRIFALEEIIRTGEGFELYEALQEISHAEDDPECSMLISHAILAVKERLNGSSKKDSISYDDAESFLASWKEADENKRMMILSNLPARLPKSIRTCGPDLLEGSSPVVASRVMGVFCRSWPEERFDLIAEKLYSDSLVLKLTALRTMVHMKPEQLLPDLPVLLVSDDPEIKALAIRGLIKIDKEEALKHLQAFLLSPKPSERLAGIQNCLFLPFDMVKPLLLNYFAAENNPELLTKAGWIIEMNPDVEVPFKLFEISERSPAKKAELVKSVLNEAVKLLNKSGILGDKFNAYTKKLQDWVNKRNALRYAMQIVSKLGGETVTPDVEKSIFVAKKQHYIVEAFKEALSWSISDLVKSRIRAYLGEELQRTGLALKEDSGQDRIACFAKEEKSHDSGIVKSNDLSQLEMLSSVSPEKAKTMLKQLLLMLSHKGTDISLKIAVFQCLTRCRLSGAEDIAVNQINNKEISLATAAVEYLGIVNPDMVFPYIGQCLKVSDVGMKSAALGILKIFDFNQAISSLRAMLFSYEQSQQRMALECMNQFDFGLIREMLTDFLCKDFSESLLELGLLLFAGNPSAENAYSLYKIEQAHQGKIAEQAKLLREACQESTADLAVPCDAPAKTVDSESGVDEEKVHVDIQAEKQKKEEELKERLRLEKEKQKTKKPDYAYRSPSELQERTSKQQIIALWNMAKDFASSKALPISILAFIAVATAFYVFFVPKESSVSKQKSSAVVAEKMIEEGTVKRISNGAVTVELTNGEKVIMMPKSDGFLIPEIYSKLRIEMIPYRKTSDGKKVVKIVSLYLIKEFSNGGNGYKK